jgi:hypothetical protein
LITVDLSRTRFILTLFIIILSHRCNSPTGLGDAKVNSHRQSALLNPEANCINVSEETQFN